jgi:3-hydroxyacyl-[acyl-carrier-protein] dehydratase
MDGAHAAALAALPHGKSFRFVETLTALEPGHSATGTYHLRGDEAFLEGHFPGSPILPGVILIEALAQLGGIVAQTDPAVPPLADMRLAAVRQAKITGTIAPGERLTIKARLTGRMGGLVMIEGTVQHDAEVLLTAQVTLSGTS